jgi:hypothetical protein
VTFFWRTPRFLRRFFAQNGWRFKKIMALMAALAVLHETIYGYQPIFWSRLLSVQAEPSGAGSTGIRGRARWPY